MRRARPQGVQRPAPDFVKAFKTRAKEVQPQRKRAAPKGPRQYKFSEAEVAQAVNNRRITQDVGKAIGRAKQLGRIIDRQDALDRHADEVLEERERLEDEYHEAKRALKKLEGGAGPSGGQGGEVVVRGQPGAPVEDVVEERPRQAPARPLKSREDYDREREEADQRRRYDNRDDRGDRDGRWYHDDRDDSDHQRRR